MTLFASAVASSNDHGYEAGRYVAGHILAAFQRPPALMVAAISHNYDQAEVVRGLRSVAGSLPLIGCSATHVYTMAGSLTRGVGALAFQSGVLQGSLSLAAGLGSQPEQTAASALTLLQAERPTATKATSTSVLMLADALAGNAALTAALQAVHMQHSAAGTLIGAAAGADRVSSAGRVFVNDEVLPDALALGLIDAPAAAVGFGVGSTAQAAAQQARAALGNQPPAAAIVVSSGAEETMLEAIREVIGHAVPLVGMETPAVLARVGDKPTVQEPGVLVYLLGQG